jgi:hypothetical protein
MPKLRHYSNGLSVYKPPLPGGKPKGMIKRKATKGWTRSATNNNKKFLQSVNTSELTGHGYALTNTVKDCPASPELWNNARDTYLKRLKRKGMIRYHWVTEWQARGCPHLHMTIFFEQPLTKRQQNAIIKDWLEISFAYGANSKAQTCKPISNVEGWLKYNAKHGARGAYHYQRSGKPPEWEKNTGRVWGKGGDWPVFTVDSVIFSEQFYPYRRILRNLRISRARQIPLEKLLDANGVEFPLDSFESVFMLKALSKKRRKAILFARCCLKANNSSMGQTKAVSEWIPFPDQVRILENICDRTTVLPHQNLERVD